MLIYFVVLLVLVGFIQWFLCVYFAAKGFADLLKPLWNKLMLIEDESTPRHPLIPERDPEL